MQMSYFRGILIKLSLKYISLQFETMKHKCLYLEWLQSYAILMPFRTTALNYSYRINSISNVLAKQNCL